MMSTTNKEKKMVKECNYHNFAFEYSAGEGYSIRCVNCGKIIALHYFVNNHIEDIKKILINV